MTRQAVLVPAVPTQGLTFQAGSTTVVTLVDTGPLDGAYESSQLLPEASCGSLVMALARSTARRCSCA